MTKTILTALALLGLLAAGPAFAHEYKAGDLTIGHPWTRATAPGAKVGGGFLTIQNKGATADRLVAVDVPFAEKAELHESTMDGGVAKMRPLEAGAEIKPGETVTFEPGGKHVMFLGLKDALTQGARMKGELTFEKAGKVAVEFAVEAAGARPAAGGMDHLDHMDHMDHGK